VTGSLRWASHDGPAPLGVARYTPPVSGVPVVRRSAVKYVNIAIAAVLAAALTACTGDPEPKAGVLEVSPASSLLDEPVRIRVTGLSPGQRIELTARMTGLDGGSWSSQAIFVADGDGVVDLDRDAPESGDYTGVDGMGLIAALTPPSSAPPSPSQPSPDPTSPDPTSPDPTSPDPTSPDPTSSVDSSSATPADRPSYASTPADFPITVAINGGAETAIRRVAVAPGVTIQDLTVAEHGVAGVLVTPSEAAGPGVLLIGGSEGGLGVGYVAMALMLAAHGYPALAVASFNAPGLPGALRDIPLEYFASAASRLPGPVRVIGVSRGSEAALLLAARYPNLVAGTVLAAPSDRINLGFPAGGYAWTFGNVPQLDIPFSAIAGPVLAIAGTDDRVWPSATNVTTLKEQLGDRLTSLVIEGAGHDVLGVPYLSANPATIHPVTGDPFHLGGTRQGNEQARRQSWSALLSFLASS
jgi:dienelactone hydrolase